MARGRRPAGRRRLSAALLVALATIVQMGQTALADEPAPLRRAYVPAGQPQAWPSGEWTPLPLTELNEFLESAQGEPGLVPQPVIERAVFRGTWTDAETLQGSWEALVRRPSGASSLLEIGAGNLAMSRLAFGDLPAAWGAAVDGRMLLIVERDSSTLTGEWSLRGRSVFGWSEFQFRSPQASSLRIELQLPETHVLRCSSGVVLEPAAATAPGMATWGVELGAKNSCKCVIEPRQDAGASSGLLYDRSLVYSLRSDECRVQADFTVHPQGAAPPELVFQMAGDLENPAVTYAGAELSARIATAGESRRLAVTLPAVAAGRLATLRIMATRTVLAETDWTLPDISLTGAHLLSGSRRVDVDRPWTLQSIETDGVRQTGLSSDAAGADWYFEDLTPQGRLVIRIGYLAASLSARVLTRLELQPGEIQFRTAASIRARSGSTFQASFALPVSWGVVDVLAASGAANSRIAHWRVDDRDGSRILTVTFRQALRGASPSQIAISGRVSPSAGARGEIGSAPLPLDCDDWEVLTAVRAGEGLRINAPESPAGAAPPPAADDWQKMLELLRLDPQDSQWKWLRSGAGRGHPLLTWEATVPAASPAVPPSPADAPAGADHAPVTLPVASRMALSLQSTISDEANGWNRHQASYVLTTAPGEDRLTFRLPAPAELLRVSVDGETQFIANPTGAVELPELSATAHGIEVRYRTPNDADRRFLGEQCVVALPEWSVPVSSLTWRIDFPQPLRPTGLGFSGTLSHAWSPGWSERFFGPLAATAAELPHSTSVSAALNPPAAVTLHLVDLRTARNWGWVVLLGGLCLTVFLRRSGRASVHTASAVFVLMLLALIAPVALTPLCGGALAGSLIGSLLPRGWIVPRDLLDLRWPARSKTAGRAVAATHTLLWIVVGSVLASAAVAAQRESAPTGSAVDRGPQEAPPAGTPDILIPYNGRGLGPVGYVSPKGLARFRKWRESGAQPDYLLRSSRYEMASQRSGDMRVELSIVILSRAGRVRVLLPFRDVSIQASRQAMVDDVSTPLLPAAGGGGFLVDVPGIEETAPSSADAAAPTARHRVATIVFWCRPLPGAAMEADGIRIGIPPIIDSQLVLPGDVEVDDLRVSARGRFASGDGGQVVRELGAVAELRIESVAAAIPQWTADAVSLIEVHPLRARVRTELTPWRMEEAAPRDESRVLILMLPGRSDVRDVTAETLRSFSVHHASDETTLVEIEFDESPPAGRPILLDFTVPVALRGEGVAIPPLVLLGEGGVLSHRLGVRAMRGFAMSANAAAAPRRAIRELPVELFSAGLASLSGWPVPEAAFIATAPSEIDVHLQVLEPVRTLTLHEDVTFESDVLRWTATAEIDVALTSAFQHEFHIPDDLRIDSVSVFQEGADRLLDWGRSGDRLLLLLQADRTGRQTVQLSGWRPVSVGDRFPLPRLSLEGAQLQAAELAVRNRTSHVVELLAEDGAQVLRLEPERAAASGQTPLIARLAGEERRRVSAGRMIPAPPDPEFLEAAAAREGQTLSRLRGTEMRLDPAAAETVGADVALIETVIWREREGSAAGLTLVHVAPPRTQAPLRVRLPTGTSVVESLWDGAPVSFIERGDGQIMFPIEGDGEAPRILELQWTRARRDRSWPLTSEEVPLVVGASPAAQMVTILPAPGRAQTAPGSTQTVSSAGYALLRAEALVELLQKSTEVQSRKRSLTPLIVETNRALRVLDELDGREATPTEATRAVRRRWTALQESNEWPADLVSAGVMDRDGGSLAASGPAEIAFLDGRALRFSGALKPTFRLLEYSPLLFRLLLGAASALLLLAGVRLWPRLRSRFDEWRSIDVSGAGLVVLGLLWWTLFRAAPAGLLLFSIGLLLQIRHWPRTDKDSSAPAAE